MPLRHACCTAVTLLRLMYAVLALPWPAKDISSGVGKAGVELDFMTRFVGGERAWPVERGCACAPVMDGGMI